MIEAASKAGITELAHGANTDDLKDYRPGFSAASEFRIAAPMIEAGLSKQDIRDLSKMMLLETWNKPAMACLSTRIPYGTAVTIENLKMIEDDFIVEPVETISETPVEKKPRKKSAPRKPKEESAGADKKTVTRKKVDND